MNLPYQGPMDMTESRTPTGESNNIVAQQPETNDLSFQSPNIGDKTYSPQCWL